MEVAQAPTPQADPSRAEGEAEALQSDSVSSVGVLGWLGFIIINVAAWGIVSITSVMFWGFGFIACLVYTLGLIGLAFLLERGDRVKFHKFANLLWMLAATFVFVCGLYIAVHLIGPTFDGSPEEDANGLDTPGSSSRHDGSLSDTATLVDLLPDSSSDGLQEWAATEDWETHSADHALFGGSLYFTGRDEALDGSVLLRQAGGYIGNITPSLFGAEGFVEYESDLLFKARSASTGQVIWRIQVDHPDTAVPAVSANNLVSRASIKGLFVDMASSNLYFKGSYSCSPCYVWVKTIFSSDGTNPGTVDLRGDPCASACGSYHVPDRPIPFVPPVRATLWAILLVAITPMMLLAGIVLVKRQMPGLFVNLYWGFEGAVIIAYLLVMFDDENVDEDKFGEFLKWFLTGFNSLLWLAIAVWSLRYPEVPQWQEDLKTWAVAFVGTSFFVMIHIVIQVPFRGTAWRWICYAVVTVVQILLAAIVSRTVPMVTGAIGLFVLSWKVAIELMRFWGILDGMFGGLALLGFMALEGLAIIVGAMFFSSNRTKIEGTVRAMFRCDRHSLREMTDMPFVDIDVPVP